MENLLDNSSEFLCFVTDKDLYIRESNSIFNETFQQTTGFQAGQDLSTATLWVEKEKCLSAAKHCLHHPSDSATIDVHTVCAHSKEERWFRWEISALRNNNDIAEGVRFVGIDITKQKLADRQLLYQATLLDNVSDAVISTDTSFIIKSFNKSASFLYGLTAEEVIGQSAYELFKYEYVNDSAEAAREFFLKNYYWKGSVWYTRQDGGRLCFEASVTCVRSSDGSVVGYVAVNRDITAIATNYKSLFLQDQLKKSFLDALKEGIVIQNSKGEILECNKAAERILGLSADQMMGRSSMDARWKSIYENGEHFPGDQHPAMVVLKTGTEQRDVIMGVRKPNGKLTWISISSQPIFDRTGRLTAVASTFIDITKRRTAEEEKSKAEGRFRITLSMLGDNAWQHNFQTSETIFSENLFKLIGQSGDNPAENAKLWWDNIFPEDRWRLEESDKDYRAGTQEGHNIEYRMYHTDGSIKWIRDRGVVIDRDDKGMPLLVVGTHTDITAEKQLSEKLIGREKQKKKEILRTIIEAQEKERQEIAYELHDNISQVLSSCRLLLETVNNSNYHNILKEVRANIDQAIDEVRGISHQLNTTTLELIGLAQLLSDIVGKINHSGKIVFSLNSKNYKESLLIDPKISLTIFRIVQEQIKNVLKHSGASKASIHLSSTRKNISVTIKDNGKGFAPDSVKKGLGLINIFNRVEYFNGIVQLDSIPGQGCSLKVIIPIEQH
jgi:PAS domain S-box-containing protein